MGTVQNGFSRMMLACLAQEGIDNKALFGAERVDEILNGAATDLRPLAEFDAMMDAADALPPGRDTALLMAKFIRSLDLGPVGFLTLASQTLQEAAEAMAQFYPLICDAYTLDARMVDGHLVTCMHPVQAYRSPHIERVTLGAMCWHNRAVAGDFGMPFDADFAFPAPDDDARVRLYEETFGGTVRFGAETTRLIRPKGVERLVVSRGEQGVRETLRAGLMQQIAKRDEAPANLMQEVEGCIRARLEQGEVRIEDVAQSLGLSVRTLQSRLEGTGLNYRQVVDRVRHTLALAYLADVNVSLVDVSAMLGFASQSSFNRAFMRWAGMAPGEYRRTKVQGEAPAGSRRRPPGG